MTSTVPALPDIRRSISVSWNPDDAFRRFTADFAAWWPRGTHSIGGRLVKAIVFECRVGGRIFEELRDGRRFLWGRVTAFDPPRRVAFTWHPSREQVEAQDVTITFTPEATGTRVELVSSGWDRLGPKARGMRRGYDIGWGSVLDAWVGRRSAVIMLFTVISGVMTVWRRMTGGLDAAIDKAGGRMPADSV